MGLDRFLAVVGLLLSLPGFFLLFMSDQETVAVLALGLGLVVLLAAWTVYYFTNLPEYSMKLVQVTLDIKDAQAQNAQLKKAYQFKPNYAHLDRMLHRNIAADGSVADISWNGRPVPPQNIRQILGEYEVTINFPAPSARWTVQEGELSYNVPNSFPGSNEALYYVVDFPTRVLKIRILFPDERPCRNARAMRNSGGRKPLRTPTITNGGRMIEYVVKRPLRGAEYSIHWDW